MDDDDDDVGITVKEDKEITFSNETNFMKQVNSMNEKVIDLTYNRREFQNEDFLNKINDNKKNIFTKKEHKNIIHFENDKKRLIQKKRNRNYIKEKTSDILGINLEEKKENLSIIKEEKTKKLSIKKEIIDKITYDNYLTNK